MQLCVGRSSDPPTLWRARSLGSRSRRQMFVRNLRIAEREHRVRARIQRDGFLRVRKGLRRIEFARANRSVRVALTRDQVKLLVIVVTLSKARGGVGKLPELALRKRPAATNIVARRRNHRRFGASVLACAYLPRESLGDLRLGSSRRRRSFEVPESSRLRWATRLAVELKDEVVERRDRRRPHARAGSWRSARSRCAASLSAALVGLITLVALCVPSALTWTWT